MAAKAKTKGKAATKRPAAKQATKRVVRVVTPSDGNALLRVFADRLKGWPTGTAGPRPTGADFERAAQACAAISKRPGTEFMAVALYMRPTGATQGQVISGLKSQAARNVHGRLVDGNVCRSVELPPRADTKGGRLHRVYALQLKGTAPRKAPSKRATKPVGEQATKATPATGKPADVTPTPAVTAPATA